MSYDQIDDRILVEKCLMGDQKAWNRLVEAHFPRIAAIVKWQKWGLEPQEWEDLIQDALEQVIVSLKRYVIGSSLVGFVHIIAVRCCIARLRERNALKRHAQGACIPFDTVGEEPPGCFAPPHVNASVNPEQILLDREEADSVKRPSGPWTVSAGN